MLRVGFATASIEPTSPESMGGYWGRTATCEPCRDELSCRVLHIESSASMLSIVSLDLIGVSSAFALTCREHAASMVRQAGTAQCTPDQILLCCTHTHTGPQTHDTMVGFGHATQTYKATLKEAIGKAVAAAAAAARPAVVRHVRTPALGLSINRRERHTGEADEAPPAKKSRLMWFERAGATRLGQRADGPTVPYADALQFLNATSETCVATLFSFACHPVCCGKLLPLSSDYVHKARLAVEEATAAPAIFLTGAAGDVNPLERGGGYAAADALGARLGAAVVAAIESRGSHRSAGDEVGLGAPVVASVERCVEVPLAPAPTEAKAREFLGEQKAWHSTASEQKRRRATVTSADAAIPDDPNDPAYVPSETVKYAQDLVALAQAGASASGGLCQPGRAKLGVMVAAVGSEIAIVGIEAEPFSEFALHIAAASPFPITITVGYANGCLGYLPTHAEFQYGGYEVMHAHVPYGQLRPVHPTAERAVVSAALDLLHDCHSRVATTSATSDKLSSPVVSPRRLLLAEVFDSGFAAAHDTYNSMGVATSCQSLVYVLSSAQATVGAKLYRVPLGRPLGQSSPVELDNVSAACADPPRAVVQGKAHCPLVEDPASGLLYFGTHCGFYTEVDGMETLPVPPGRPSELGPYPGGCLLELSVGAGSLRSLARIPGGEGIVTMTADLPRGRVFCLSWPSGYLYVVERTAAPHGSGATSACETEWVITRKLDYPGRGDGESVHPSTGRYRPVCRAMVVDPRTGSVYWTSNTGSILEYAPHKGQDVCELLRGAEGLSRDYLGKYDPNAPGSMGSHWRQVQWVDGHRGGCIVGIHGNSGYLFELDVGAHGHGARLELIERLTSRPSRRLGMADQFSYGYLGFAVSRRGIVYYLTGAPIFDCDGKRVEGQASINKGGARGLEHLHLVTYDLKAERYDDHGPIFYRNRIGFPTYVNSIALGEDGFVYALARLPDGTTDLFRVQDPHASA